MLGEGLYAVGHHQQQAGGCQMVPLPHQLANQEVGVQQVQRGEQGLGGGGAVLLQLQAHLEQLVPCHLRVCAGGEEGPGVQHVGGQWQQQAGGGSGPLRGSALCLSDTENV